MPEGTLGRIAESFIALNVPFGTLAMYFLPDVTRPAVRVIKLLHVYHVSWHVFGY